MAVTGKLMEECVGVIALRPEDVDELRASPKCAAPNKSGRLVCILERGHDEGRNPTPHAAGTLAIAIMEIWPRRGETA